MRCFASYAPRDRRKKQSIEHSNEVIDAKGRAHFISCFIVFYGLGIFTGETVHMSSNRVGGKHPHGEQGEPGKELNESQLLHCFRHVTEIVNDFPNAGLFM